MRRSRYLGVALAVALPLAAVGYLGWVFYSAGIQIDRRSQSGTGADSAQLWFESDEVDPADLRGIWVARAEAGGGANRREAVLDFRPDGKLVWTTRVTVGNGPIMESTEHHDYQFERGRFIRTTLTERLLADGKVADLQARQRLPKLWKLDWKADDKSVFQLRSNPHDKDYPHLLFRKS